MAKIMQQQLNNQVQKCQCGATIFDEDVKVNNKYSLFGWFMWSQGSTVVPKKIIFTCTKCNNVFCELTDKLEIKEYMQNTPY